MLQNKASIYFNIHLLSYLQIKQEGVLLMEEEKTTFWKQNMLSFQSRGLSIKRWRNENHIAPPTFYYWRAHLENEAVVEQPRFVEVKPTERIFSNI